MKTPIQEEIRYVPDGSPWGHEGAAVIRPGQPWLGGEPGEVLNFFEGKRETDGIFETVRARDFLLGWTGIRLEGNPAGAARRLYGEMLRVADPMHLYHIWNWVPAINATSFGGEETYKLFCEGRAQGFEDRFGRDFETGLPSASAVGHSRESLLLCFVAGRRAPRHLENPEQVPAWQYPPIYGPRSPSFARASVVDTERGPLVWISGTASIKGSESVCPGDFSGQVRTTLSNVDLILARAGKDLYRCGEGEERHFRIYLRDRRNYEAARALLDDVVSGEGKHAVWVQAEICRKELEIEMEAAIYPSRGGTSPGESP